MTLPKYIDDQLLDRKPQLIETFYSLEGEGQTIGRSALFIRTNECNLKCNFCFGSPEGRHEPAITLVQGQKKKISKIEIGDKLLTFDDNQKLVETEVYDTSSRIVDHYLEIKIDDKMYYVTEEHPFFTTEGLKRADELQFDDIIVSAKGAEVVGKTVKKINKVNKELEVYNISCAPYNTYLINQMWVHNCDTSYSISGNYGALVNDMTSLDYVKYMQEQYADDIKEEVENLSITGGEPLLNIKHFSDIIKRTLEVFPNINKIVIETNGYFLRYKEICLKFVEQVGKYFPKVKFVISMSPKLNNEVSHSGLSDNQTILNNYVKIVENYTKYLDAHCELQVKCVHSDELVKENESLINIITKEIDNPITKDKILIMPFTPPHPLDKDKEEWEKSKDAAARYALKNHYRYSPRIHIDRKLA